MGYVLVASPSFLPEASGEGVYGNNDVPIYSGHVPYTGEAIDWAQSQGHSRLSPVSVI